MLAALVAAGALAACSGRSCKNVLYILADDLRADLGVYGQPALTPNLDKLAKDSLVFGRAYCQISVCAPSRMSFMTGHRPDTYQVWNFIDTVPLTTQSTPGHFKDNGYLTLGLGKAFHQAGGAWNADKYWDQPDGYPYYKYTANSCPHGNEGGGECTEVDDKIYDWHLRTTALTYLQYAMSNRNKTGQPFYVSVGFRDPHAPWAAPKRIQDLYNGVDIAPAKNKVLDSSIPLIAWSSQLALKLENGTGFGFGYDHSPPDWVVEDQRRHYYAAASYTDEHVGDLINALHSAGQYDDTIVVFHTDHGYMLGEHSYWEKKNNFDPTVRVPMMIKVPGKKPARTESLTELIDVFPTLASLADLPAPEGVDGMDVSALFDNPKHAVKQAAYHQYPACNMHGTTNHTRAGCNNAKRGTFDFMGYSVRVDLWRYTVWVPWDGDKLVPVWDATGNQTAEELYSHEGDDGTDFDAFENVNMATTHPDVASQLRAQVKDFFTKH